MALLFQKGEDAGGRHGAEGTADLFSVFEYDESRDRGDAELFGKLTLFVDVDLCEDVFAVFGSEAVEDGGEHLTRSAPRRVKVDEDGSGFV